MLTGEIVNWRSGPLQWKVDQVIAGDQGLALSSDLDSGPEQWRQQHKLGHSSLCSSWFPRHSQRWVHAGSVMSRPAVRHTQAAFIISKCCATTPKFVRALFAFIIRPLAGFCTAK